MPVPFLCSSCGFQTKVKDELAGKKIKCPKCGVAAVIMVPTKDEGSSSDLMQVNLDQFQDVASEEDEELNPSAVKKKAPKKKAKAANEPLSPAVTGAAIGFSLLSVGVIALLVMFVLPEVMANLTPKETPPGGNPPAAPANG